jgi:hypothetical protein
MTALMILGLVLLTAVLQADQPPAAPKRLTFRSPDGRWWAISDPATQKTTMFLASSPKPVWQIDGWHGVGFVSNGGTLILGHPGSNLLPTGYKPTDALLRFYANGALKRTVSVQQMIDPKLLRRTASHYFWGAYQGIHNGRFLVELVDGRHIAFDPDTGERLPQAAK